MTVLGIDYSGRPPKPQIVRDAGYRFVARYLSNPGNPKNLTPGEAAAMLAADVDIVCVWETTASRALGGPTAGRLDGQRAAHMIEQCGAPATAPIFYAVDFDAQPRQFDMIAAYLTAARDVSRPHPVGVYGSYYVCEAMLTRGAATYAWQTAAWSHRRRLAAAHLYQRIGTVTLDGTACDVDEAVQADFGGWGSHLADHPDVPVHEEDDDMRLRTYQENGTGPEVVFIPGRGAHQVNADEKRWLIDMGLVQDAPPLPLAPNDARRWFGDPVPSQ